MKLILINGPTIMLVFTLTMQQTQFLLLVELLLEDFGNSDILTKLEPHIVLVILYTCLSKMELLLGETNMQMSKQQLGIITFSTSRTEQLKTKNTTCITHQHL